MELPINDPAVKVAGDDNKKRKRKQAPMAPLEFLIELELMVCDKSLPFGPRLCGRHSS